MENLQQIPSRKKYFEGMLVGILILVKEDTKRLKWLVRCTKCGAEFEITRSMLTKYSKGEMARCKNCPIIRKSKLYPNGSIYGKIEILNYLDNEKFLVKCHNCGREYEVSSSTIREYKLKCPEGCKFCTSYQKVPHKYKPGQVLGNCFELIKLSGNRSNWLVKCTKCGKEQELSISNMLKHKKDVCYYCEHPYSTKAAFGRTRKPQGMNIDERIYTYYKNKILGVNTKYPTRKQKEFNLTLDEFSKLIHENCYYCGSEPTEDNVWNKSGKRSFDTESTKINSIDRIDSDKGYSIDNCVPCCIQCNRMKLDYTQEQFLDKVKQIYLRMFNDQLNNVAPSGCETGDILTSNVEDEDMV